MGKYTVQDADAELIPEDTFVPAELTKVEEGKIIKWKQDGEDKEAEIMEWHFKILDGQWSGQTVRGSCDPYISDHEANKFRLWTEGLLGRDLVVGEEVDPQDLIGLKGEITVTHKPGKGKNADKTYVNLEDVAPLDPNRQGTPF